MSAVALTVALNEQLLASPRLVSHDKCKDVCKWGNKKAAACLLDLAQNSFWQRASELVPAAVSGVRRL
jgi:hypothetical protein